MTSKRLCWVIIDYMWWLARGSVGWLYVMTYERLCLLIICEYLPESVEWLYVMTYRRLCCVIICDDLPEALLGGCIFSCLYDIVFVVCIKYECLLLLCSSRQSLSSSSSVDSCLASPALKGQPAAITVSSLYFRILGYLLQCSFVMFSLSICLSGYFHLKYVQERPGWPANQLPQHKKCFGKP